MVDDTKTIAEIQEKVKHSLQHTPKLLGSWGEAGAIRKFPAHAGQEVLDEIVRDRRSISRASTVYRWANSKASGTIGNHQDDAESGGTGDRARPANGEATGPQEELRTSWCAPCPGRRGKSELPALKKDLPWPTAWADARGDAGTIRPHQ